MDSMIGNLKEIDIKRLRIYMTIVDCGGFVQAQNELGLSASTISVRMSELEDKLGLRLCQRGRAGFSVTPEGESVYKACQSLVVAHENFNSAISSAKGVISGELRLGVIDNVIFDPDLPVSHALAQFRDQSDNLEISLYTMAPSDLQRAVLDQRLHLAIGVFYQKLPGLDYLHLCHEKLVLYCGKGHVLFDTNGDKVSDEQLADCFFVERTYGQTTSRLNRPTTLNTSAYSSSLEATALLILSGKYIGFLPRYYANLWCDKGLMKPINENRIFIDSEICIASHQNPQSNLATSKLLKLFLSYFDSNNYPKVDK